MTTEFDVGIVGAGVLGLAHAYHFARRGLKVIVFERGRLAHGASVRNFGMIWPVGQPLGDPYTLARRSRDVWLDVLRQSGIWHRECGSLHVAYHDDEAQVLRELVAESAGSPRACEVISPDDVVARSPHVVRHNLKCGLWSHTELVVDPRQVIAELPGWLHRTFGVQFAFNTPVLGFDLPTVRTPAGDRTVNRLVVCTGSDFRELAPDAFAACGLIACKLQMMRTQAFGDAFQLGPHLCAGLTLCHYGAFARCPTLPALARRFEATMPEYRRAGIHVLVSQTESGELTLGDTHVYGDAIDPFDNPHWDDLVLDYLRTFLSVPGLRVSSRWNGTYVKHPSAQYAAARLAPNAMAVTGVGGAGMTLSFGLAERTAAELLGESE